LIIKYTHYTEVYRQKLWKLLHFQKAVCYDQSAERHHQCSLYWFLLLDPTCEAQQ